MFADFFAGAPLTESLNKYLKNIEGGTLRSNIDIDLKITVEGGGAERDTDYFSKGYRSDGNEDGFHEFSPIRQKRNESSARRKRSKIHRSRQALTCAGTAMA